MKMGPERREKMRGTSSRVIAPVLMIALWIKAAGKASPNQGFRGPQPLPGRMIASRE
jgi:hypothetical protein